MSSEITCVKSESTGLPDRGSSPSFVLSYRKRVRCFFTTEIQNASLKYTFVSYISISLALRILNVERQQIVHCSI
jgi:hypothetical protein